MLVLFPTFSAKSLPSSSLYQIWLSVKEEVLTCKAFWQDDRDASQSFMVATLDYLYRRTLEDRIRCFLVKKALTGQLQTRFYSFQVFPSFEQYFSSNFEMAGCNDCKCLNSNFRLPMAFKCLNPVKQAVTALWQVLLKAFLPFKSTMSSRAKELHFLDGPLSLTGCSALTLASCTASMTSTLSWVWATTASPPATPLCSPRSQSWRLWRPGLTR